MRMKLIALAVALYMLIISTAPLMALGDDERMALDEGPGYTPSTNDAPPSSDCANYASGFQGFEVLLAFVAVIVIVWAIRRFARRE